MASVEQLKTKYEGAIAWAFGDSPELANELAELVVSGKKTASCGSLTAFQQEAESPAIGSYSIILNGDELPVCVIRTVALRLIRFSEVTEDLARKEGEGDLSLRYWRQAHQAFFERSGNFAQDMELVMEEFELVERLI